MSQVDIGEGSTQSPQLITSALKTRSAWITIILPALAFWTVFVWINGPSGWETMVTRGLSDNDDLMRFAQIRDLLAGQAFFDLHQSRMNAPYGLDMHWSRLVDLPIAGLFYIGGNLLGDALAGPFAVTIWPMLTLLPAFIALGFICRRLAVTTQSCPVSSFPSWRQRHSTFLRPEKSTTTMFKWRFASRWSHAR